jgi:enoyl-CoA hydratase/carnithine racemase
MVSQPANEVEVARSGAVLHLRLNRPARRNALTWAMYKAMIAALADGETDAAIRVIQFSGAGDGFCAGKRHPTRTLQKLRLPNCPPSACSPTRTVTRMR